MQRPVSIRRLTSFIAVGIRSSSSLDFEGNKHLLEQYGSDTSKKILDDMKYISEKCAFVFPRSGYLASHSMKIATGLPLVYWMCAVCLVQLRNKLAESHTHLCRVIPSTLLRLLTERIEDSAGNVVRIFREIHSLEKNEHSCAEMKELIEEEIQNVLCPSLERAGKEFRVELDELLDEFYCTHTHLTTKEPHEYFSFLEDFYSCPNEILHAKSVKLDIQGMAGGEEAWKFASELHDMYYEYLLRQGNGLCVEKIARLEENQKVSQTSSRRFVIRLTRKNNAIECFSSKNSYTVLRCLFADSGIHRIQRVPQTESSGRMHTSTASVCLIPEVTLKQSEKSLQDSSEVSLEKLEEECDVSWTHGSGPGGQAVNTGSNCCVLFHRPTRTSFKCHKSRSALENKFFALENLRSKLKAIDNEKKKKKLDQIRRMQAHTGERNEKIRSFNALHNTVCDHRFNLKVDDCDGMLSGRDSGDGLQTFYDKIISLEEDKRINASVLELQQSLIAALFPRYHL